jgi:hypothetical protein
LQGDEPAIVLSSRAWLSLRLECAMTSGRQRRSSSGVPHTPVLSPLSPDYIAAISSQNARKITQNNKTPAGRPTSSASIRVQHSPVKIDENPYLSPEPAALRNAAAVSKVMMYHADHPTSISRPKGSTSHCASITKCRYIHTEARWLRS